MFAFPLLSAQESQDMESPASSRLQLMVALGCVWNGCQVVQALPVLLLRRSLRVMFTDPEIQEAIREKGHSPDLLLATYDVGVVASGFEIAVRLLFLAILCGSLTGHRAARWVALAGVALVLGNDWQWSDDWWVWLVDLGIAGGLVMVLWTPEPRRPRRRPRDIPPRVFVISSE
jgi:hypothetical protein